MRRADVITSLRHAGSVKRYHTWPTIRHQTIADHTWHVLRILITLFPEEVTVDVLTYVIWHDVPEVGTGDSPFYAKRASPELKSALNELEGEVLESMGLVLPELTSRQRLLVKVCDLLEMHQWGTDELRMGNQYARPIIDDTRAALIDLTLSEPGSLHHDVLQYMESQS